MAGTWKSALLVAFLSMLVGGILVFVALTFSDRDKQVAAKVETTDKRATVAKDKAEDTAKTVERTRVVVKRIRQVIIQKGIAVNGKNGLRGAKGPVGQRGPQGPAGPAGKDAEPLTAEQIRTALTILCGGSCKGADGHDGRDGKDAAQVTQEQVNAAVAVVCSMMGCLGPVGPPGPQGPPGAPATIPPCATLDPALGYACVPPPL